MIDLNLTPFEEGIAMTTVFDDSYYTAFLSWAFEPPPIAKPATEVVAVRINPPGQFPSVVVGEVLVPVIGTTPAGWLSSAGAGWCQFIGNREVLKTIATACNAGQKLLLEDYPRYEAALRHHRTQEDDVEIGGLHVIAMADGQRVVRLADIAVLDVRAAIYADLNNGRRVFGADQDEAPRINTAPPGYLDAELWWFWSRNWTG